MRYGVPDPTPFLGLRTFCAYFRSYGTKWSTLHTFICILAHICAYFAHILAFLPAQTPLVVGCCYCRCCLSKVSSVTFLTFVGGLRGHPLQSNTGRQQKITSLEVLCDKKKSLPVCYFHSRLLFRRSPLTCCA